MIVLSYGGGTQTIAVVLLILAGKLPRPDMIVCADTGREASETWEYTERYTMSHPELLEKTFDSPRG